MNRGPPDQEAKIRELGEMMQHEAPQLAKRLMECGADATSFYWPAGAQEFRYQHEICIPAAIADYLLAVMLSLSPRPRGRPAKKSTQAARVLAEMYSQRKAARTIAATTGENPEIVRVRLVTRKKKRPRKPRE
jgi:hypothetical protein